MLEREKGSGIKCGTFGHSDFETRTCAAGDYAGVLNIWDLERVDAPVFSAQASDAFLGGSHAPRPPRRAGGAVVTLGPAGNDRLP